MKSTCCNTEVVTVSSDEGTGYYKCSSCQKGCDAKQPKKCVSDGVSYSTHTFQSKCKFCGLFWYDAGEIPQCTMPSAWTEPVKEGDILKYQPISEESYIFKENEIGAMYSSKGNKDTVNGYYEIVSINTPDWQEKFDSDFLDSEGDWHKTYPPQVKYFITSEKSKSFKEGQQSILEKVEKECEKHVDRALYGGIIGKRDYQQGYECGKRQGINLVVESVKAIIAKLKNEMVSKM